MIDSCANEGKCRRERRNQYEITAAGCKHHISDWGCLRPASVRDACTEGYSVDLAADGISGLELLSKTAPSAILLDLSLPDISGKEIYQKIIQVAPRLPIIVVSAKTDVAEKAALLAMGAYDYVTKPFSPRELLASVRAALRDRRRSA
jgi:DNA-binding response OmpR family regulator